MRIEEVGVASDMCFGEEKKMKFSRGEVVFYRLKIRSETANVAEVNEEKVEGCVKTFWVANEKAVRSGDISGFFPKGDSKAGFGSAIFLF
ncbi:hypothetical protein E2C01_065598 [Portunus trituberculatus]|uniref:Uncharacterized protein n=1 Tax=Portunus trituberculatus TaxID=210409 RepID=A0A5B7HJ95_PORTR|nr:hypothetical protein [Portunus trituberculatus]